MAEPKKAKDNDKEKKKGSKTKILIIVLIFFVIVGASFAVYTLFFSKKTTSTSAKTSITQNVISANTYSLDECLVNLTDAGGKNYLKVTVFVGYESSKVAAELETKKPIIRDVVINILRSKSSADFSSNKAEKIKTQILNKINPLLTKGKIDNVYFDDILVQ